MLAFPRMVGNAFARTIPAWLAFLTLIPMTFASTQGLREEAIGYRTQGYEAQQRGDYGNALAFYQKAAALDPTYATPLNDIGVLLESEGRLQEAEVSYQRALSLNPTYLEAHANVAMLYERMGQKEKAIYHWLKRYQLGDPYDPWTARAEERLIGLGALKSHPGVKGTLYSRRRVLSEELQEQAKSVEEFHAVTEQHGGWPPR